MITNHWSTNSISRSRACCTSSPGSRFESVQSGHNNGSLSAITDRARLMPWQASGASNPGLSPFNTTRKAAINIEAVYDDGGHLNGRPSFVDYRARQAGYLSWLSGSFGYTWGVGGLLGLGRLRHPAQRLRLGDAERLGHSRGSARPGERQPPQGLRPADAHSRAQLLRLHGRLRAEPDRRHGRDRRGGREEGGAGPQLRLDARLPAAQPDHRDLLQDQQPLHHHQSLDREMVQPYQRRLRRREIAAATPTSPAAPTAIAPRATPPPAPSPTASTTAAVRRPATGSWRSR